MRLRYLVLAGAFIAATVSLPAAAQNPDSEYCKSLPGEVREAIAFMPKDQRIPCDAQHVVLVTDLHKWVVTAAKGQYDKDPRYKAVEKELELNLAFTFGGRYPVYLNLPRERMVTFRDDSTAAVRFSCVLQHEFKHANDHELRESVAYQVEIDCLKRYEAMHEVPTIAVRTAEQYRDAFKREEDRKVAARQTAAVMQNGGN